MSTLNVSNITDGTDTVETGYVLNGSAKAWGKCDATGTITSTGSLNVSSVTDNGTNGKLFTYTSGLANKALGAAGVYDGIGSWAHGGGALIYVDSSTTSHYSVRYYNSTAYTDADSCFSSLGDLA